MAPQLHFAQVASAQSECEIQSKRTGADPIHNIRWREIIMIVFVVYD